jgi:hypothetical protein
MRNRAWLKWGCIVGLFVCLLMAIIIFRIGPIRHRTHWTYYWGIPEQLVCADGGRIIIGLSYKLLRLNVVH